MERNDIIKALEVCVKGNACTLCPLVDDMSCARIINENALALITSQEQRIGELTADLEAVRSRADETIAALRSEVRELTSENEAWQQRLISEEEKSGKAYYDLACEVEDLRAENERLKTPRYFAYPDGRIEPIPSKADTVREMQERLHKRFRSERDAIYTGYNIHRYIDQITKEMVEGSNDT